MTVLDGLAPVFRAPNITRQPERPVCSNPLCVAGYVPPMHYILHAGEDLLLHCIEGHDCTACRGTSLPQSMLAARA